MLTVNQQIRLQTWFSSSFPTGAYSYSHGLETAIQNGIINDTDSCKAWLSSIMTHGSLWNDSLITCCAHAATDSARHNELLQMNKLALALSAGAERYAESTQMGSAFLKAASAETDYKKTLTDLVGDEIALPVAIGSVAAHYQLPSEAVVASSLQASSSNLVWIATRLIPLGQTSALQIIEQLLPVVTSTCERVHTSSLDDLGSCTVLSDIMSMQHESIGTRICLT